MKQITLWFCLLCFSTKSQTIADCRYRFTNFLNYHGQLSDRLVFSEQAIYFLNQKKQNELSIYKEEIQPLAAYFETCSSNDILNFLNTKGNKKLSAHQVDSIQKITVFKTKQSNHSQTLQGLKIAIDPGHFGTNLKDAAAEQKFLKLIDSQTKDTILIFESILAFNTAALLKHYLEAQGAQVFLTRQQAHYTSFNCSFDDWMTRHKTRCLDSLVKAGQLNANTCKQLKQAKPYKLFWDFFREFELANRAKKINEFHPNLTIIVHYNVNEKNAPWISTSDKNFTMTFIPGAFTNTDINKPDHKANFIRLLLTNQLNQSERLAALTVNQFSSQLNIPKAKATDATYLKDNCLSAPSSGVYSRNLYLCRKVNSVLVYGESLYQDNEKEIQLLRKNDLNLNGIQTNLRVQQVAKCYFDAVMEYFK